MRSEQNREEPQPYVIAIGGSVRLVTEPRDGDDGEVYRPAPHEAVR
jgi:hypothetical protein